MSLRNKIQFAEKNPNPTPDEIPFPHYLIEKASKRISLPNSGTIFVLDKGTELLSICQILEDSGLTKKEIKKIVYPCFLSTKASFYECRDYGIDLSSNIQQKIENNTMISDFEYFFMNPAYNGKHKAEKPWIKILLRVIKEGKNGAKYCFIIPRHWITKSDPMYSEVLDCMKENLSYLEEHYIDKSVFKIGEEVSLLIFQKKDNPLDGKLLETFSYFDKDDIENNMQLVVQDASESQAIWRNVKKLIFESKKPIYNSRTEASTKKTLISKKINVSETQTASNCYKWYNTTKNKGTWWTDKPGKNYFEAKIIIDASGTYYKENNLNSDGSSSPIVVDSGNSTAGKNVAQFLEKDLGISKEHFLWYITHPLMRFAIQEKPDYSGSKFLKELYSIPKINSHIDTTEKLYSFFNINSQIADKIDEYFSIQNQKIDHWETFEKWKKK